jgi:hypothetical protein
MRITRLKIEDGKPLTIETPATQPTLLIALPSGRGTWIGAGERTTIGDAGQFLRIDFLTRPQL